MRACVCLCMVVMAALGGCEPKPVTRLGVILIDSAEAAQLVSQKQGLLGLGPPIGAWVDPRNGEEFAKGHIVGAVHLPSEQLSRRPRELEGTNTVVVYGNDAEDVRAETAARRLIDLGYLRVRLLKGGLKAWREGGGEVEQALP